MNLEEPNQPQPKKLKLLGGTNHRVKLQYYSDPMITMTIKRFKHLVAFACIGLAIIQCLTGAERRTQRVKFISTDSKTRELLPSTVTNEILARGFGVAEGPVWDSKNNRFLFSDIQANSVYSWSEDLGLTFFLARSGHTGFAPIYQDSLLLGANGLAIYNDSLLLCQHGDRRLASMPLDAPLPKNFKTIAARYDGKRMNSPNDIVVSKGGHVYFTDPPYGFADLANSDPVAKKMVFDRSAQEVDFCGIYKFDLKTNKLELISDSMEFPNGVGLSPDEKYLYVNSSDMTKPEMMRFDLSSGEGELFFNGPFDSDQIGWFDGMDVHPTGAIFTAGPGGVVVVSPEGKHLATIGLDAPATNLCFDETYESLFYTGFGFVGRIQLR